MISFFRFLSGGAWDSSQRPIHLRERHLRQDHAPPRSPGKVRYEKKADAAFIRFSAKRPTGGVEVKEGVILHVTDKDQIVALEILDASQRLRLKNLFKLEVSKAAE